MILANTLRSASKLVSYDEGSAEETRRIRQRFLGTSGMNSVACLRVFAETRVTKVPVSSAGNQRSRPSVSSMMPNIIIALAIGLVVGFILGYGVRAVISYRRRLRARRRSYLF